MTKGRKPSFRVSVACTFAPWSLICRSLHHGLRETVLRNMCWMHWFGMWCWAACDKLERHTNDMKMKCKLCGSKISCNTAWMWEDVLCVYQRIQCCWLIYLTATATFLQFNSDIGLTMCCIYTWETAFDVFLSYCSVNMVLQYIREWYTTTRSGR